jgi:hypothetical protein
LLTSRTWVPSLLEASFAVREATIEVMPVVRRRTVLVALGSERLDGPPKTTFVTR